MNDLTFDVGQAYKLKGAFMRNGWTPELIEVLCEGDKLAHVKRFLRGYATLTPIDHIIDCNRSPFVPEGWTVEEHLPHGQLDWSASKFELGLSIHQKTKGEEGTELRKALAHKLTMNANVLEYLLAHPYLIPEDWKGKNVFFWGTIYRDAEGEPCVRCLYWPASGLSWSRAKLNSIWYEDYPAAVSKY